ncbi:MAG TPA: terpene cyclase, partial [Candidatus Atribacteria bacterium]|nr:terpene cyclase [Candidatus Atribacteria bacterium]
IYTLLKAYDFDNDQRIIEKIPQWADFLLFMQSKEKESYGAFHYSFYFKERKKELKFVVGTTALSIFTLLDLYQRTGDSKYLEAAKLGGDWLVTMQKPNGVMKPYKRYDGKKWVCGQKESLLYNGQVLSAFSRLYKTTEEKKYYNAAQKIANHFIQRIAKDGCFLGDDYRNKNPISSVWAVKSLLDFYRINPKETYKNIIFGCSKGLLNRQLDDPTYPLNYGRWQMAFSTSGNGWLAEVMMEIYHFCREQGETDCEKYKKAVLRVIRWLIQNTYSEDNSADLQNPERAISGIFWNYNDKYVRTDSVCHALNAYLGIINDLGDGFPFVY